VKGTLCFRVDWPRRFDLEPGFDERPAECVPGFHDYLWVVEVLDSIPRRTRTPVGRLVLDKARLAGEQDRPRYFVMAAMDGAARILFISYPGDRQERREFLHLLTTLVHAKYLTVAPDPVQAVTLGVATEPYPSAGRSHDYLLFEGEVWDENEEFVRQRDELYSTYFPSNPESARRILNGCLLPD
jgi:hypothetical protein